MDYRQRNKVIIKSVNKGGFSSLENTIKYLEEVYSNNITKIDTTNQVELYKRLGQIELINSLKTRLKEEQNNA